MTMQMTRVVVRSSIGADNHTDHAGAAIDRLAGGGFF